MSKWALECCALHKEFRDAKESISILKDLNLQVPKGEMLAILGRSGSGKTTLLQLLGALDKPSQGNVLIDGQDPGSFKLAKAAQFRNRNIGFIFQLHHLLMEFTARENVAMPCLIAGQSVAEAQARAHKLLSLVHLEQRSHHRPSQLSGGERQRVAIARALACNPSCVLADEPTGNLDAINARQVFDLMRRLNQELQTTFIIVTHDAALAAKCDRRLSLENGQLIALD